MMCGTPSLHKEKMLSSIKVTGGNFAELYRLIKFYNIPVNVIHVGANGGLPGVEEGGLPPEDWKHILVLLFSAPTIVMAKTLYTLSLSNTVFRTWILDHDGTLEKAVYRHLFGGHVHRRSRSQRRVGLERNVAHKYGWLLGPQGLNRSKEQVQALQATVDSNILHFTRLEDAEASEEEKNALWTEGVIEAWPLWYFRFVYNWNAMQLALRPKDVHTTLPPSAWLSLALDANKELLGVDFLYIDPSRMVINSNAAVLSVSISAEEEEEEEDVDEDEPASAFLTPSPGYVRYELVFGQPYTPNIELNIQMTWAYLDSDVFNAVAFSINRLSIAHCYVNGALNLRDAGNMQSLGVSDTRMLKLLLLPCLMPNNLGAMELSNHFTSPRQGIKYRDVEEPLEPTHIMNPMWDTANNPIFTIIKGGTCYPFLQSVYLQDGVWIDENSSLIKALPDMLRLRSIELINVALLRVSALLEALKLLMQKQRQAGTLTRAGIIVTIGYGHIFPKRDNIVWPKDFNLEEWNETWEAKIMLHDMQWSSIDKQFSGSGAALTPSSQTHSKQQERRSTMKKIRSLEARKQQAHPHNDNASGSWAAKFQVRYYPMLSSQHETDPIIMVWTSLEDRPRKWFQMHEVPPSAAATTLATFFSSSSSSSSSTQAIAEFTVTVPRMISATQWPRDAAVHFQVFVRMENSDGPPAYEKAGSGAVYLADFLQTRGSPVITTELILHSYLTESDIPVIKGRLEVPRESAQLMRDVRFAEATHLDVTPGNRAHLEAWMLLQVRRNMTPFNADVLRAINMQFIPTFEETTSVHAPLYNNSVVALEGSWYWANLGTDLDHQIDHRFFQRLIGIATERMDWTADEYATAVEKQEADRSGAVLSKDYMRAVEATASALCLMANSLVYIGDYAYVPDSASGKYNLVTVEDFADGQMKNAADCEDDSKLIGRVYRGVRDGRFPSGGAARHALAMQAVARRYVCLGTLGSVTSRNIAEAATEQNGGIRPHIGDQVDRNMTVGAHMWVTLMPRAYYRQMIKKTTSANRIPFVDAAADEQQQRPWERALEVMVCEGTGPLRPIIMQEEARYTNRRDKEDAVFQEVKMLAAIKRAVAREGKVSEVFNGAQYLRRQAHLKDNTDKSFKELKGDPDRRLTTFYRVISAFYPIPEAGEDRQDLVEMISKNEQPSDIYTTRCLIPVQIGGRGNPPKGLTWGVNMTDLVYKRDFVGAFRTLRTGAHARLIVSAIAGHLPPYAPINYEPTPADPEIASWNADLRKAGIPAVSKSASDTLVVLFWRKSELEGKQAQAIVSELSQNKSILGANFVLEHLMESMATVRLEMRVSTSDIVALNPSALAAIFDNS